MELLTTLSSVSDFHPDGGYSGELLAMAMAGLGRADAMKKWAAKGRSETSFYKAYKALKDDLLRLSFVRRKSSGIEGRRLEVWDKYSKIRQLLIVQEKDAAVSLAVELVRKARAAGFTEIVAGLASLLENHFGAIAYDARNYRRYKTLRISYSKMLADEVEVRALQTALVVLVNRGGGLSEMESDIEALKSRRHGSYTFMRYRFSVLSIWFDLKGDTPALMSAFRETAKFYEECEVDLPVGVLVNLYFRVTPRLVTENRFADAEAHLSQAFETVAKGSQSWHLFMLQKACIGLVSGKTEIVRSCVARSKIVTDSHGNPDVWRRWDIVRRLLDEGGELGFDEVWKEVFG